MKNHTLLFFALFLMLFVACSTQKNVSQHSAVAPSAIDGEWCISAVAGKSLPVDGNELMIFDKGGSFNTDLGCNKIMGQYTYASTTGEIGFGDVASTLMACPDNSVEDEVKRALPEVVKVVSRSNDYISFLDKNGRELILLQRKALPLSYLEGEWRIMRVATEPIPSDLLETPVVVFDTKAMRLGGTTGCNSMMASLISDNQDGKITISSVATTRMACGYMAFETAVVRALESVRGFKLSDSSRVLLTDANGSTVMEIMRHM